MEINLILAILLSIFFMVILPSIAIFIFINNKRLLKILGIVFFIVFLIILLILTLGNVKITYSSVILSFVTNNSWFSLDFAFANFNKQNILLNTFMLFPVGAFVISINTKHSFIKTILISLVISLIIETLQFVLPVDRTTEILDLILNTISGIIGYGYFYLVNKFSKRYEINLL